MNYSSSRREASRYDTESVGAGANEREAGVKGPEEYAKAILEALKPLIMRPTTLARIVGASPESRNNGKL